MRITQRYLKEWLSEEFKRLEIEYTIKEIYKTRLRPNEYEAGAAHFIIRAGLLNSTFDFSVFVPYPLYYLQKELNNGYELIFKLKEGRYLADSELDIRKK